MTSITKILGLLGFAILIIILFYLILRVSGIIHSIELEQIILGIVLGQVFYNGYVYRAVHDIGERLKDISERLKSVEQKNG